MKTEHDFIVEMDLKNVTKYKEPKLILLSGLPGSGKSTVAREASKDLGVYLLSNDYVRNYFWGFTKDCSEDARKKIEKEVKMINCKRLAKLLTKRTSFVFDADINSSKQLQFYEGIAKLLRYQTIKIKLQSDNNQNNIKRIAENKLDYKHIYDGVIGDAVAYSSSYPENVYYEILARKQRNIPDSAYDYVIDNEGTKEEFLESSNEVMNVIKKSIR